MPHIRRDWYQHDPPTKMGGGAPVASVPAARTPRPRPLGRRPRTVVRRSGAPTWQTIGAMVAGSVLGLALLGAVVYGTIAGGSETVAGQQTRRPGLDGAPTGAIPTPPERSAPPGGGYPAPDTRPTTGDPALDRVLREAEPEGRLTPEQVAAIGRAISGEPIFEDVRRLTEADIERLADATGLAPEQLAPFLARLVATGRVVMPARPPQAVAGSRTQRPEYASSDETVAGATAARDQAGGFPAGWPKGGAPAVDTQAGPPWK